MRTTLCALLAACCLLPASAQSPWARSKAGFYAQAAYQSIPAYGTLFGKNGSEDIEMEREVSENTFQLYGEYGLSRKTTLVAAMPLVFNRRGVEFSETRGQFGQGHVVRREAVGQQAGAFPGPVGNHHASRVRRPTWCGCRSDWRTPTN